MTDQSTAPWYKQPWLWFILAPLIATLLYSTVYITASVVTHDGVVLEEYSKKAKAFHEDKTRTLAAKELGLNGKLRFDLITNDISVQLNSTKDAELPKQLQLTIGHPTKSSLDIQVSLRELQKGHYVGELKGSMKGRKTLILSPPDNSWLLVNEAEPPYDQQSFSFGDS